MPENIFKEIGFSEQEAANLRIRARLMMILEDVIKEEGLTQKQAAKLFGVSQPRVSDLMRGKIDRFTIDALVNMLAVTGRTIRLETAA